MKKKNEKYKMFPIGGGDEIGASCYAVQMGGERVLLDAGIRFGAPFGSFPSLLAFLKKWDMDGLWELSAVIISHAHLDHMGALPTLLDELGTVPVYSSPATLDLMRTYYENFEQHSPASSGRNIAVRLAATDRLIPKPYGTTIQTKELNITLFPAGHIPGAAMTLLEDGERRVLYTGDFCDFAQHTVGAAEFPQTKVDTLICECTCGYRNRSSEGRNNVGLMQRLNALLDEGSLVECCVRSIGRAAELAGVLRECANRGEMPDVDIWVDPDCEAECRVCERWGNPVFKGRVKLSDRMPVRGMRGVRIHASPASCGGRRVEDRELGLFNHAGCSGILNLIAHVRPTKVILVHGSPLTGGVRNIVEEARERFGTCVEVAHSKNGQEMFV